MERASRRSPAVTSTAAAFIGLFATGCQIGGVRTVYPEPTRPPLSMPFQRTIPLRFVVLAHCAGCSSCETSCRPAPSQEQLVDSVEAANQVFVPAGVRFVIGSIERAETADWWQHGGRPTPLPWYAVRDEARRVFPWIPPGAWANPYETKPSDVWLSVLTAVYPRPYEITVIVQEGGSRAETGFPEHGRAILASDHSFGHGRNLFLFAHELGHYFGLRHTFAHEGTSPITGTKWRLADRWDLVYHPGSGPRDPNVFFHSHAEAAPYRDQDLRLIEHNDGEGSSCTEASDGALECVLPGVNGYSEVHRSGSDALKGLSLRLAPDESSQYRWARNVTDYGTMAIKRRLSASQLEMLRVYLQYPMRLLDPATRRMRPLPDGVDVMPSHRTSLGLLPPY